jgi:hypothetical protein
LIAATPGDFVSINMEVNPSSPPFTGYWTRRGLDGIERIIVIDDVKYKLISTEHIMIINFDANDVGFYTLYVTNGVDSGHNEPPVIVGDKSCMRKGQGSVCDKWNISMVICSTDIP